MESSPVKTGNDFLLLVPAMVELSFRDCCVDTSQDTLLPFPDGGVGRDCSVVRKEIGGGGERREKRRGKWRRARERQRGGKKARAVERGGERRKDGRERGWEVNDGGARR